MIASRRKRCMGQILVRNLEDSVKRKLQRRAARHGRSMEEEVRDILRAAAQAASLMARRHLAGRPRELRDTMIAGIAQAQRATLATRNVQHFDDLTVPLINPWQA